MAQDLQKDIEQAIQDEEALEKVLERKEFLRKAWIKRI